MSDRASPPLALEKPIFDLEVKLNQLRSQANHLPETVEEIRRLNREIAELTRRIYENLTPWETVLVARHPNRPYTPDYISLVFDEFVELHGDRRFGDDRAIVTGFAKLGQLKVLVVGQQKGRTVKKRTERNFAMPHPEGYRKALAKMKLAAKFGMPIICFIDTPGAYPGLGAEERGQHQAIAENMFEMSRLPTPIVCLVIGEGGSGGALGIGLGDRVAMLQYAYYSVISPEGCAGILWKSHKFAEQAAQALKFTSKHLPQLGVVDDVIEEPLGGAHRDHFQTASRVKLYLTKTLRELVGQPIDALLETRYAKYRRMGAYLEQPLARPAAPVTSANGSGGSADEAIQPAAARHPELKKSPLKKTAKAGRSWAIGPKSRVAEGDLFARRLPATNVR